MFGCKNIPNYGSISLRNCQLEGHKQSQVYRTPLLCMSLGGSDSNLYTKVQLFEANHTHLKTN